MKCVFQKIWLLILLSMIIIAPACTLQTSKKSVTDAKLRRIVSILNNCSNTQTNENLKVCINNYADKNGVSVDAIMMDAYGEPIVLKAAQSCKRSCEPYSKGPDKTDDCSYNDDIIINQCH
jgi:hypothetical protein